MYPHATSYLFVLNLMSEMRSCGAAMLASRCLKHTLCDTQVFLYMASAEEPGTQLCGQQPVHRLLVLILLTLADEWCPPMTAMKSRGGTVLAWKWSSAPQTRYSSASL